MGKVDYSEHASLVNPPNGPARLACRANDAGSLCGRRKKIIIRETESLKLLKKEKSIKFEKLELHRRPSCSGMEIKMETFSHYHSLALQQKGSSGERDKVFASFPIHKRCG